jgi:hypothetical protein
MAYYIFLKSLRSLKEFRKNPHVKIPLKSPCANFQSLGKFKNPIFNSKILFSSLSAQPTLRPTWSLAQLAPLASLLSQAEFNLAGPASPCVDDVFAEVCFPFWFAPSELAASLLSLCQVGLGCQFHLPPPRSTVATSSHCLRPPHATRPPTSRCQARSSLHTLIPPPLNFTP